MGFRVADDNDPSMISLNPGVGTYLIVTNGPIPDPRVYDLRLTIHDIIDFSAVHTILFHHPHYLG